MKPAVLCLNCEQFARDLAELKYHGRRYRYVIVPDTQLFDAQPWLPEPMRIQAEYVNFEGPDVDALWDRSRAMSREVIESARRSGADIVAVLAAHWDYWNEEGMRLACAELGLPFLVLLREAVVTADEKMLRLNVEYHSKFIRIPQPAAVALSGEPTLELFEKLNLFSNTRLAATGWPRFDVWRRPAQPLLDRPVVLMSYFKGYYAPNHFSEMLALFNDIARSHPGVPFVVKAKHPAEAQELSNMVHARGLSFLQVVDVVELPTLICNARAVIGFNSMIMYESLLSPAHLILPYWGETEQDHDFLHLSPHDERLLDHMTFATSGKILREMVDWAVAGKLPAPDMEARARIFGEFFTYTADKTCLERVEDFIEEAVGGAS